MWYFTYIYGWRNNNFPLQENLSTCSIISLEIIMSSHSFPRKWYSITFSGEYFLSLSPEKMISGCFLRRRWFLSASPETMIFRNCLQERWYSVTFSGEADFYHFFWRRWSPVTFLGEINVPSLSPEMMISGHLLRRGWFLSPTLDNWIQWWKSFSPEKIISAHLLQSWF